MIRTADVPKRQSVILAFLPCLGLSMKFDRKGEDDIASLMVLLLIIEDLNVDDVL